VEREAFNGLLALTQLTGTGYGIGTWAMGAYDDWQAPTPATFGLSAIQLVGPAGPVILTNAGLVTGGEYYNIFSPETCGGGVGTGPYLGLCASTPAALQFLIDQVVLPVGSPPFHFIAGSSYQTFGPFFVFPVSVEAITIRIVGGGVAAVSPVAAFSILERAVETPASEPDRRLARCQSFFFGIPSLWTMNASAFART
jgi:hypothetical protein